MNDTRKDKRAPVSLKVRFKSATVDEFVEHYSRDISHGGLFIKSKQPMAIGTLLKFELQLKDESKLIQGVGRVVWKRDSTETTTDEAPAGMGIKFIKMDPESRGIVEKMVDQRGAEPGQYEAGGGDATKEDDDVSVGGAALASTAAARPVRSAKATMAFFPAANLTEADMPPPEDRTQVRQASEFLAAALAEGGEDNLASQEAEKKAEEARKRTEEIEKERDAAAAREKADVEAKERAEKEARERAEREKTERAQEKSDAEQKKAEDAKSQTKPEEAKLDQEKKDEPKKDEAKKAEPKKDESKKAEPKKAEVKKDELKKDEKRPVVAAPVAVPPAEPQSNMLPIFLGIAVIVAVSGYFVMSRSSEPTPTHEVTPTPDPVPTVVEPEPVVEPTVEPTVQEVAPPVAPTIQSVRIPATPSGAEVFLNGERLGLAPGPFDAPVGSTLDIRLAGHREAHVVVAEGVDSLQAALVPFPYVVNVVTTPSGATVRVAGQTVTSPARVELASRPMAPTRIQVSLAGFQNSTTSVLVPSFAESNEAMVAEAQITLTPVTVRTPRIPTPTTTMMEATTMTEATPEAEPTMEAAPEPVMEATMEAAPEPEAVPENPF